MYFVSCGNYNYGPFASESVMNLWLEAHAPTGSFAGLHSICDENIHRHNHTRYSLIEPIKGVSRHAEVDVTIALAGQ